MNSLFGDAFALSEFSRRDFAGSADSLQVLFSKFTDPRVGVLEKCAPEKLVCHCVVGHISDQPASGVPLTLVLIEDRDSLYCGKEFTLLVVERRPLEAHVRVMTAVSLACREVGLRPDQSFVNQAAFMEFENCQTQDQVREIAVRFYFESG